MSSQDIDFRTMFRDGRASDSTHPMHAPAVVRKRAAALVENTIDSTKWRAILSLEMRGSTKREIAQALGCTPQTVGDITSRPEYKEMREEVLGQADREFLDLKPLAVDALRSGLRSRDENTALRASDQFFRVAGYGSYGKGAEDAGNATAENVARALLQQAIQVNVTVNTGEKDTQ